jgi:hypothetical protein
MFVRKPFTATGAFSDCPASQLGADNKVAFFFLLVDYEILLQLIEDISELSSLCLAFT